MRWGIFWVVGRGWAIILGSWECLEKYFGWVGVGGGVWDIILSGWGLVGKYDLLKNILGGAIFWVGWGGCTVWEYPLKTSIASSSQTLRVKIICSMEDEYLKPVKLSRENFQ